MRRERCIENPKSHLPVLTKLIFFVLKFFLKIELNNYDIQVLEVFFHNTEFGRSPK